VRIDFLAALVALLLVPPGADARPSGDALVQVLTPTPKSSVPAHPHVNVVVLFGTTPDGAVPDPATFRARLNGADVTGRFEALADGELGGAVGLRAVLDDTVVRTGASNRLRVRVRSEPFTQGARTRRVKDRERVRFAAAERPNEPPVARAGADSDVLFAGMPIRFDASTSTDPEVDPLTYAWDFGDGDTAEGPVVEHTYASGTGDVAVTVVVSDGAATGTKTLVLPAEPTIDPGRTKGLLQIDRLEALEFGGVALGVEATRTLTITNQDATPTSQLLVRASASGASFTLEPTTLDLGPGEAGTLTVRFAPSAAGHAEATVTLVASASNRAAVSFLAHGFGGAAAGSGPTLAARPVFYGGPHATLAGVAVYAIRADGSRVFADNVVHECVVPGDGPGTGDACLTDPDCALHGGTCDTSAQVLFDPEDLCADPEGNLAVLSTDGAVTDPNPNALTEQSSALLRISLDASGSAMEKALLARVTGDTTQIACDDVSLAQRGRVYVSEYFDVDSNCDRTEREALVAIRKDGGGSNVLKARLDSIQGIDDCNDLEDATAALATEAAGDPLFVAFDLGGVWRFDEQAGHRAFVSGIANFAALGAHPDGAVLFATAAESGTRTVVNLYKVSPSRVAAGPLAFAGLTPCATHTLPNNDGRLFVGSLAVDVSAADPATAIALVSLRASTDALAGVLAPALAPQGTVAFTVPSGSADTCTAVGLITLDPLDLLSF
jgi:PKD repeat protein